MAGPLYQLSEQGQSTPVSRVCFGFQLWLAPLPGSNGFLVSCELVTPTDNSPTQLHSLPTPGKCLLPKACHNCFLEGFGVLTQHQKGELGP